MKKRKQSASLPKPSESPRGEANAITSKRIGVSDAAASVSSAWERLKVAPSAEPVVRTEAGPGMPDMPWSREVIPGKCTCNKRTLEGGEKINPWVYGHTTWCSMFLAKCPDCGCSCGTHLMECVFWAKNPTLAPF